MDKTSKGFMGRTVRAILFIILIIASRIAVSSIGMYLASRYGLAQPREQVPLTALYLGDEERVELPGRGRTVERNGWRPRNSRDSYTLTLGSAVIGDTVMKNVESSHLTIDITGDLTIKLKEGSNGWIRSEGTGIRIHSGTLVIRRRENLDTKAKTVSILGNRIENGQAALRPEGGQLDIKGTYTRISCLEMGIAGGAGTVSALGQYGTGICPCRIKVEESEREMTAEGNGTAVPVDGSGEMKSSIKSDGKMTVGSGDVHVVEFDATRPEYMVGHEEEIGGWMGGTHLVLLTYSTEDMVAYNEDTSCFDGSTRTPRFVAE